MEEVIPKLSGAHLCEADLNGAILSGADLRWSHLNGADLRAAELRWADLLKAELMGANLSMAILINTNLDGADLTGAAIYGISAEEVSLKSTIQKNLIIRRSKHEVPITLDDLEVAQFIYLRLNRSKLRNVIDGGAAAKSALCHVFSRRLILIRSSM